MHSSAWSIHIKKKSFKKDNSSHAQQWAHSPIVLHGIRSAGTPSLAKNWQIRSGLKSQIGNLWDFGKQPWGITYKGFTIFAWPDLWADRPLHVPISLVISNWPIRETVSGEENYSRLSTVFFLKRYNDTFYYSDVITGFQWPLPRKVLSLFL